MYAVSGNFWITASAARIVALARLNEAASGMIEATMM